MLKTFPLGKPSSPNHNKIQNSLSVFGPKMTRIFEQPMLFFKTINFWVHPVSTESESLRIGVYRDLIF